MNGERWLCIDQGGQSSRAAVFDERGRVVAFGRASVETSRPDLYRVEHDPDALVRSVSTAISAALETLGDGGPALRGAALATQRSTLVCAERGTGRALSPIISWQDRRGAAELDAAVGPRAERVRELTGLRVSPHYGVGKLRWCLAHLDPVRGAARRGELVAAPLAAFLLYRLGVGATWQVDPVNASRMLLMDLETLDWSPELLALFEVDAAVLPLIRSGARSYGMLRADGVEVPVRVCTGDQPAALYAAGRPPVGTVVVNVGTGAFIQCATGAAPVRAPGLLTSVGAAEEAAPLYVLEGTVNGAAAAVESALDALGMSAPTEQELDAAFAAIAEAPLYLNGVSGLGSPDWVPDFASGYVGEGPPLARLAAVYESIVFLIVRNLAAMRRSVPLGRIVLTGGLARIDWLAQRLASLAQLPVERPEDAEATLHGLYTLLAGRAPEAEKGATTFEPVPCDGADARYAEWTALLEAALGR
jgi:glycerol kinase